jgi:hypothetical protein
LRGSSDLKPGNQTRGNAGDHSRGNARSTTGQGSNR